MQLNYQTERNPDTHIILGGELDSISRLDNNANDIVASNEINESMTFGF